MDMNAMHKISSDCDGIEVAHMLYMLIQLCLVKDSQVIQFHKVCYVDIVTYFPTWDSMRIILLSKAAWTSLMRY